MSMDDRNCSSENCQKLRTMASHDVCVPVQDVEIKEKPLQTGENVLFLTPKKPIFIHANPTTFL